VLRVVSKTPWGPVIHVMNAEVLPVLDYVDGHRTGRQILDCVRTDLCSAVDERAFLQVLAVLKRAAIIVLKNPAHSTDARGVASAARAMSASLLGS
jgi:hypothetical protein